MVSQHRLVLGLAAAGTVVNAGPCDIYASGGTPCVAAHSTTRALYSRFNGALYQVLRGSDGATKDIYPLSSGGVANAGTQDSFCGGTTCLISIIYDQSGKKNHLTRAPKGGENGNLPGPEPNGDDFLASAIGAPVKLNGQKAYGVFISPFTGYRCDTPHGTATGDQPEGMYAVLDGTHYNGRCCFDYGNAETNNKDNRNGAMETIYFGTGGGSGSGNGPWIMADLENGLFSGYDRDSNPADPTINDRFITAVIKGEPHHWAIRGGNAASGGLSTFYDGKRPAGGYDPMSKEGAIVLGVGGDNSNHAQGTFYEGVMTSGYPSADTENKVQANIVDARYTTAPLTSGPSLHAGASVSMRATTPCCSKQYLTRVDNGGVRIETVSSSSDGNLKQRASYMVRTGLGNSGCFSFESKSNPGFFIRHSNYELKVDKNDDGKQFAEDATWCPEAGINGQGNALHSWNYPARYMRHYQGKGYLASNGGPFKYDAKYSFNDDASFVIGSSFA